MGIVCRLLYDPSLLLSLLKDATALTNIYFVSEILLTSLCPFPPSPRPLGSKIPVFWESPLVYGTSYLKKSQ